MTGALRIAVRALITWAVEAAALYLILGHLPGVTIVDWQAAATAILAIGLLNALIRPAILLGTANLGVIPFLLIAFVINAFLILVASWIVHGFDVDGLLTAFLVAFGLAGLNALFTAMLSVNDDDSFYRNVIRRLAGRFAASEPVDQPGTVIVQIDGLAEPILRRALGEGRMPTLAAMLASGSHQLVSWECDIPSMTTSAQAGILHGDNRDIPAFYWYEKRERRLMSSANPRDLYAIQQRLARGDGLLHDDGVSVTNLFSGDAGHTVMTVGTLLGDDGTIRAEPRDFYGYLLNPYNLYRGLIGSIGEALLECWQGLRQWLEDVQPRRARAGLFALLRGAANIILRDATTWAVVAAMYRGRHIVYCNYVGYDEVGHYAGPETRDAVATLMSIDRQLRQLISAAREAPRPYTFVVLSDHGQTTAPIFESVYGKPLHALVRELIDADRSVHLVGGKGEGPGYLSAFLGELLTGSGRTARGARRVARLRGDERALELPRHRNERRRAAEAEIVVTSSGSLGHIYFADVPDRLTLEEIASTYPGLIEALVGHAGLEFALLRSAARGAVVLGKRGVRELDAHDVVEGEDPLGQFSSHTAEFLRRLAGYGNAGDIIVNGTYSPSTGHVIGIDDLVGAHGGVGGMQTQPFLLYPLTWTTSPPDLIGSAAVREFLQEHIHDRAATASTSHANELAVARGTDSDA